jgi:hypothetical protein
VRLFGEDTSPEVEALLIERYRRMTPAQKAAKVASLTATVHAVALAGLRLAHPDATERELKLRLAARTIDRDLLERAFGPLPDADRG